MADTKKLIFSIVNFLRSEVENSGLPVDKCENLEVTIQCLKSAYIITPNDSTLTVSRPLLQIFQDYLLSSEKPVSPEDEAAAERLKNEGNLLISQQDFPEAIESYSKAIKLDPKKAVLYCNRAAAHSKLNNFNSAIKDCKTAIHIDPLYSKAYGRLGLAYFSINQHQNAWDSYKKALDLEPDNENYRNNLQLIEDRRASDGNVSKVDTNPGIYSMASQMLSNPSIVSMLQNLTSGTMSQDNITSHLEELLQASQQYAHQLQLENPELVEQLRRQFENDNQHQQPPTDRQEEQD